MDKLISVIIPVFNNEERIVRCISSVLQQSYGNIELVIVNDGSTDGSEEKIKSVDDGRMRYIFQENAGPSVARNRGLDVAKGEYIMFVDSDDYIERDMIESLYSAAVDFDAEIVTCNIRKKRAEHTFVEVKEPYVGQMTWQEFYVNFLLHNGLCSLWNKLFKKSLFHNIRLYEDIRLGEDSSALLRVLSSAARIAHVPQALYVYDLTHEGISRNAKKNVYEYMIAINRVLDFYRQNGLELPLPDCFLRLKVCYYTLFFCPLGKARKIEYWDYFRLAEEFRRDFKSIVTNGNFAKLGFRFRLFTIGYNVLYTVFYRHGYLRRKK